MDHRSFFENDLGFLKDENGAEPAATDNDPQLPVFERLYAIIIGWHSVRVVSDLRRWANNMPHDRFYGIAAEELARQEIDKDLFARAYALALGDAEKTKAIYIGIRAERLEELAHALAESRARDEAEAKRREREYSRQRSKTVSASTVPPPAPEKPLPKPEDFTDPQMAAAVRAMLDALGASGGRK